MASATEEPAAASGRRTTGLAIGGRIANAGLAFAIGAIIARALGPEGRADYAIAATVATGAFALTNLGLDNGVFWAVSERRVGRRRLLRALARPALVSATAGLVVFAVAAAALLRGQAIPVIVAAALMLPPLLGMLALTSILYTTGDARTPTLAMIVSAVTQLSAVTAVVLLSTLTPTLVLLISAGAQLAGMSVMVRAVARSPVGDDGEPIGRWEIVRVGLELTPGKFAFWLTQRADVVVVSQLASRHDLGLYSLGVTLSETMLLTTDAIAVAALGRQASGDRANTAQRSGELATVCAMIAAVELVALAALGTPMIRLAFGSQWSGTFPIALTLGVGIVGSAYYRPLSAAFVRAERRRLLSVIGTAGGAINIVVAIALVPALGAVGAAIGSSVAYGFMASAGAYTARRDLGVPVWAPPRRHTTPAAPTSEGDHPGGKT
jgi:O-antigen/teichoic acid export membrane protein